ncbi:protein neuralized-like [Mya arenaria]|uniref:protein neuralized-like n=1 Tax=Mya arenaria TaxID=6604 RepID=UPI0022E2566D|nr:protein neuralized-like [Mya arenaria]
MDVFRLFNVLFLCFVALKPTAAEVIHKGRPTFSDNHGPKLELLEENTEGQRYEGGCWAVGFGAQRLPVGQWLEFNITERVCCWLANMNVGISYVAPDDIPMQDLVLCDPNVSEVLNYTEVFVFKRFYSEDNVYRFRVDHHGNAYLTPNVTEDGIVFTGVDVKKPFWPIFNIYGDTKAIQLLNVTEEEDENDLSSLYGTE